MATNNTKQAFWVSIGSLFSFGFTIVSSMILSRYFDKGDYGTYKQVMYVYNTMLTVFTLGLPRTFSYFLPRVRNEEAKDLINKVTRIFFVLGGCFSLVLLFGSSVIARLLNNPDLEEALRYFSIVPFLMLPTMGLDGILSTYKKTKFLAIYTIATRIVMLLCVALPVMLFGLSYKEAILGFVASSFFCFLLALFLKYYPVKEYVKEKTKITYKDLFKFSIPLLYASLWSIVIVSADQFFISRYYGNEVFAEFSNGSLELPFVGMIIGACTTVLSPVFSRLSHSQVDPKTEIMPLWMSVFKKTAKLIYPMVVFFIFFADYVMIIMYGEQYEVSGNYFAIKLLTNFFTLIHCGPLLINIGKVKFYSNVHMITAFVVVLLECISVYTINSPYGIAWISLICNLCKIFVMLYYISTYFSVKLYELFPLKLCAKILFPSAIMLLLIRFLVDHILTVDYIYATLIGLLLYVTVYLVYCKIANIDYVGLINPIIKK